MHFDRCGARRDAGTVAAPLGDTHDDSKGTRSARTTSFAPWLVVLLECDRPLAGCARYSLDGVDRVTLGRGEARGATRRVSGKMRTLEVRLPGRSLSVLHARLVRVGTSWAIEDLASKNGTFVGGQRVAQRVLDPQDVFEVGHTLLRVSPAVPTPEGAPVDVEIGEAAGGAQTLDPELALQFDALAKIAPSRVPVLVLGDSGTGKEVLARWVHGRTGRRGEFVAVNCGAIPGALVESTLFGHMRGSFSGAVRDEPGFVRAAQGGTLFLDEIADLAKGSQVALLRVLQEREVVPVGGTRPVPVDVRLVAATHQPLDEWVARGDFRADLFARIAGFTIRLPPIRERLDDFGFFVASLLSKMAPTRATTIALAPDAGRALLSYDWPLNIRELEQCLAASVALADDGQIELSHLPAHVIRPRDPLATGTRTAANGLSVRDGELRLELLSQLARHHGNLAEVARAMGKARMQIHRWCRRFGVDPEVYRK
jgi:sigma-54 dependent transcriptional regulator, acetoin dehydrogenase operon transcriptional activator AcoR